MSTKIFFRHLLLVSAACVALQGCVKSTNCPSTGDPVSEDPALTAAMEENIPVDAQVEQLQAEATAAGPADPAPASVAKARTAPAAASAPVAVAAAEEEPKPNYSAPASDALHKGLDEFAHSTIAAINRNVLPSKNKKQVTKNGDGTYTARYLAVDPSTVHTSYKPAARAGTVKYIGYMNYVEVEYTALGKTQKEASAGPFMAARRSPMTELVKYVNGKWTY